MSTLRDRAILEAFSTLFDGGGCRRGLTDTQLVERFIARGDERAFEALVGRHGPMVRATCRAVLRDDHDAEDAMQATFLVLARKAGSLRFDGCLGGWLHRVAFRIAVRADRDARRRRRRELETAREAAGWRSDHRGDDLTPLVHEAVDRLPERLRLPVVLCYLEGITQDEAARRLGMTEGTFRRRLAQARERLRARLGRAVGSASAGVLAALLAPEAVSAAGPDPRWVTMTARVVLTRSTSRRAAAWAATASLAAATERLAGAAGKLWPIGLVGGAIAALLARGPQVPPSPPSAPLAMPAPARPDPDAPPAPKGRRLYVSGVTWRPDVPPEDQWRTFVIDSDRGGARRERSVDARAAIWRDDDGQIVAWSHQGSDDGSLWARDRDGRARRLIDVRGTGANRSGVGLVRAPDGRLVATTAEFRDGRVIWENWRMEADGSGQHRLPLRLTDGVTDWSPDGEHLLVLARTEPPPGGPGGLDDLLICDPDGGGIRRIASARHIGGARFSPDGTRIALVGAPPDGGRIGLMVMKSDGTGLARVFEPDGEPSAGFCWSPDGSRLATVYRLSEGSAPGRQRAVIEVVGADGTGRRRVALPVEFTFVCELSWR